MKKLFNKKNLLSLLVICIICSVPLIVCAASGVAGQDPGELAVNALSKIKSLIWKIASPLAAVGLMATYIIQKASFGNTETITVAKQWRKSIIIGYIVIMLINVIMYGLDSLIGVQGTTPTTSACLTYIHLLF